MSRLGTVIRGAPWLQVRMLLLLPVLVAAFASAAEEVVAQTPMQVPTGQSQTITNQTWQWVRSDYADGSSVDAPDPSMYTFLLQDNRQVAIQADCNTGGGTYFLAGSRIRIRLGAMSLVACGPDSQDQVFLHDLGQVARYAFDADQLVITMRRNGGTMVFSPMPSPTVVGAWDVTGINNGRQAVASVVVGTQVTATFDAAGNVSGSTGCNEYHATYTSDRSSISFGPVVTTRRACVSDAASAQEQAFVVALAASTTQEFAANRLTLRDDAGATQLTMVRAAD